MTRDHAVWLVWSGFFVVYESWTLATKGQTLSATWLWLRGILPTPVVILASAVLGAVFLWLATVHWLFSAVDKPGLDTTEKLVLVFGALFGALGGLSAVKSRSDDERRDDEEAGQ